MHLRGIALLVAVSLTVAGCGGAPLPDRPGSASTPQATADATAEADRPAFLAMELTDVRTGERFTLGGFPGKVTFFIAMAVW